MLVYLTCRVQVTQTLNWVVRISSELEGNLVALERIREYCELETEVRTVSHISRLHVFLVLK
jgi:hypothetical protein